ncbi:MAG TPA: DUF1294 domain-containing protein [Bacillota bacterium]|nr:DUF1294 domain-containing protein [Bacillota bacterium]
MYWKLLWIYLAVVSVISVIITVYDKTIAGKSGVRRIPEAVLLGWAAAGGSVAMFITMRLIRHKTLHKKFTIGIPVIIVLQLALMGAVYYILHK